MVRYGTKVSVGVALEQETTSYSAFPNSDLNHPLLNSSGTSLLYDPNSTTNVTTHHQSLRITFAYQGATRTMSDVIITLSDHDQQQLIQNGSLTALERGALMAQAKADPKSPFFEEGKEIQVYSVETVKGTRGPVKSGKVYIEEIPVTPTPERKAICDSSETKGTEKKESDENNNETESTKDSNLKETEKTKTNTTKEENQGKQVSAEEKKDVKTKAKGGENTTKKEEKTPANGVTTKRPLNKTRQKTKSDKQVSFSPGRERRARSMSKSRIPIINSPAHEYYPCEYYRRKLMCDHGVCDYHTCWLNFPAVQKSAGQKVVKKMTAQQKKLEEDAAVTKKKVEFMLEDEEYPTKPLKAIIPMRKRPSRLEPILVRRSK